MSCLHAALGRIALSRTALGITVVGVMALAGCVSEEDLRAQLDAHLQESNECVDDAECAVIYPSCPLGCFAAVRADRVDACQDRADELVALYESGGRACDYDCPAAGTPRCEHGRCAVDAAP